MDIKFQVSKISEVIIRSQHNVTSAVILLHLLMFDYSFLKFLMASSMYIVFFFEIIL